jgi:diguanylate cyclase (GGDEF)-like protein
VSEARLQDLSRSNVRRTDDERVDSPQLGIEALQALEQLKRDNAALRAEVAAMTHFKQLAYRDPLTGLYNRRYLDERLTEEISRCERRSERGFCLAVIDVNKFKQINDRFGHAVGDETLKWVGAFLKQNIRQHDLCCRTGGDEFVILFPDMTTSDAHTPIARIRRNLVRSNRERPLAVGLSIGMSRWPDDGPDAMSLIRAADNEMYRDKSRQREMLEVDPIPAHTQFLQDHIA